MANSTGEGGAARQARGAGQSANGGASRQRRADRARPSRTAGESERRLREAEMLLNVTRTVAGYETLDEVLGVLVGMTTREVGAERGTLFLNDEQTGELYSRVAQGNFQREIRILNTSGIAGHVFTSRESVIVHDAYKDERFNRTVDEQTGFVTRNILCVPIRTVKDEVIGAAQALNKKKGRFTKDDLRVLESMTTQATIALQSTEFVERVRRKREQEMEFLDIVSDVTSELDLGALLQKVMSEATRMLSAERSTLFLNDEKTGELFSRVAQGDSIGEIRLPNTAGIAGAVFTSGKSVNIPHAYADLRFNPAFDKQTGFFTRSILCVPVVNKDGKSIGVTQILNKRGGSFTGEDETRLKAFTAQVRTPSCSTMSKASRTTTRACSKACRTASSRLTRTARSSPAIPPAWVSCTSRRTRLSATRRTSSLPAPTPGSWRRWPASARPRKATCSWMPRWNSAARRCR